MRIVNRKEGHTLSTQFREKRLVIGGVPAEFSEDEAKYLLNTFGGQIMAIEQVPAPVEVKTALPEKGDAGESVAPKGVNVDFVPETERAEEVAPQPYACKKCNRLHFPGFKIYSKHLEFKK